MSNNTFEQNKLVFLTAFEKVKNPETWTQNAVARDAEGKIVHADDPTACKWCSIGAMEYAYSVHGIPDDAALFDQFYKVVNCMVGPKENNSISGFNDLKPHAKVLKLWEFVGTGNKYL